MIRAFIAAVLCSLPLSAATITVNSADGGSGTNAECTLREAINAANSDTAGGGCAAGSGADTIVFAIGSGPQTISPVFPFDSITETVTIDGTTQPGYAGTPLITVDGGIGAAQGFSLVPGSDGSSIVAVAIRNFSNGGILIERSSNNTVQSVSIEDVALGVDVIGTDSQRATGNVIDDSTFTGILDRAINLINADDTIVTGNQIGAFGNGNPGVGVLISGSSTGNQIGTVADGNTFIENGTSGPPRTAVVILSGATGNSVIGNSMSFNGQPTTAIDLGGNGPTANDACDGDTGANLLQNKPVLTHALYENNSLRIRGSLNSTANSTFTIHFYFSFAASFDQGTNYIGAATVTTDASCVATIDSTFAFTPPAQEGSIIATATDAANNTSEQSGAMILAAALQVAKSFTPGAVVRTGSPNESRLTITISNPNFSGLTTDVTNLALTDAYPAGIQNAPAPDAQTTCGGTVTAAAGGTSLALSGGMVFEGSSCTVSVNVVATQDGALENELPAGAVTGTFAISEPTPTENLTPATATLTATSTGPVLLTKAFTPPTATRGEAVTLTITLSNPHTIALTNVSLTDAYPVGLTNASPANASTTCGGTVTAANGGNSIALSGGTIAAGGSCTVTVSVRATSSGTISNTIPAGSVTTAEGETNDVATTGVLVVLLGEVAAVPTASEWALIALAMMLTALAIARLK